MDPDTDTVDSRPGGDSRPSDGADEIPSAGRLLRTGLDAATWGAVLLLGASALLALVGVVVGSGLVGFKRGLFVLGFLAVGGSLVVLRPKRPWNRGRDGAPGPPSDAPDGSGGGAEQTERGPPTLLPASLAPDPDHRASWGLRTFACGIWALAVSYLLEAAFGVVPA